MKGHFEDLMKGVRETAIAFPEIGINKTMSLFAKAMGNTFGNNSFDKNTIGGNMDIKEEEKGMEKMTLEEIKDHILELQGYKDMVTKVGKGLFARYKEEIISERIKKYPHLSIDVLTDITKELE